MILNFAIGKKVSKVSIEIYLLIFLRFYIIEYTIIMVT